MFDKLRFIIFLPFLSSVLACTQYANSGDVDRGKQRATICAQCHGVDGISIVPVYPNLAGQKEQYLVLALKAYRSGERVSMAMSSHARNLSDEEINNLAAFYANMPANGSQSQ